MKTNVCSREVCVPDTRHKLKGKKIMDNSKKWGQKKEGYAGFPNVAAKF